MSRSSDIFANAWLCWPNGGPSAIPIRVPNAWKIMSDDKTPMERFDDLLSRVWDASKKKPKPQEDAQEIEEGGVPPTSEGEPDE